MNITKMNRTLRQVIELLVNREYEELESLTNSERLNATEIKASIDDYGGTLVSLPESELVNPDIVLIDGATPTQWDVRISLWTLEEGKSDLTLELTLKENKKDIYDIQLDNLHVL